jgi:hypothetical protein
MMSASGWARKTFSVAAASWSTLLQVASSCWMRAQGLTSHGLFDLGQLVEAVRAEDVPKRLGLGLDSAARSGGALE